MAGVRGHVFPAIAVAQYLQKQDWDICWLGTVSVWKQSWCQSTGFQLSLFRFPV